MQAGIARVELVPLRGTKSTLGMRAHPVASRRVLGPALDERVSAGLEPPTTIRKEPDLRVQRPAP
jgi:hypothetical protein